MFFKILKFGIVFVRNVDHFCLFDDVCHKRFISSFAKSIWCPSIVANKYMYGAKNVYLTVSFQRSNNLEDYTFYRLQSSALLSTLSYDTFQMS